jgi:acyl-CoA thioester hydrolase
VTGVPYTHRVEVRYLEVDQQGVVFNSWYLAYLDDAMTGFLAASGLPYPVMRDEGYDVQLVHTELDWTAALAFGDVAEIDVAVAATGRTSFTLDFTVRRGALPVCGARTVYVCVGTDGSGKRVLPEALRGALSATAPAAG